MGLTIAIPKGRLGNKVIEILKAAGVGNSIDEDSRKLIFNNEKQNVEFILLKNSDVITYVENGIADIGISGKDMIMESSGDFYELYKMNIGRCKMSVAGFKGKKVFKDDTILKVATKYPGIVRFLAFKIHKCPDNFTFIKAYKTNIVFNVAFYQCSFRMIILPLIRISAILHKRRTNG
jgi:ATP phosphoribosyltransferase